MSSSDDDIPLIKRPGLLLVAADKKATIIIDDSSDDDSPLPSWLAAGPSKHETKPLPTDSSDDEIKQVLSQLSPVKKTPSKQQKQQHVIPIDDQQPNDIKNKLHDDQQQQQPKTTGKKKKPTPAEQQPFTAGLAKQSSGPLVPSSSSLPIMLPEKLSTLKMILELEHRDEAFGATDLSGDSGAIGRIIINTGTDNSGGNQDDSNKSLQIDLKGVMYDATIVQTPVTMAVVNIGPTEAKIECLLSEFVQLREDARFAATHNGPGNGVLHGLYDDDYDDQFTVAEEEDGGGGGKGRKKAGGGKAAGGGGGGSGGGGRKKKKAPVKRKPAAPKKKVPVKRKPGAPKKKTAPKKKK